MELSKPEQEMNWVDDPATGAKNLLENCIGLQAGETVVLVCEAPGTGHYDPAVGDLVAEVARDMDAQVTQLHISQINGPEDFPDSVSNAMQVSDHAIFFSQAGDQVRFCETPGKSTKTMTYTLDMELLGSPFGTVHHGLMKDLAALLRAKWAKGGDWVVTCPMGTNLNGHLDARPLEVEDRNSFTIGLFPFGILPPIDAATMSGTAATKWVMSTQNRRYEPNGMVLDDPAVLHIESGRITNFSGPQAETVRQHYDHVAGLFDIDPNFVHSWHTGHHPKTHYTDHVADDMTRWGTVTFNSPRYTHLHTCGNYPPGEIAIIVIDATITLDGEPLWQDGRFVFTDQPEAQSLLSKYPGYEDAYDMLWNIGL
jgi:hypothetical protein